MNGRSKVIRGILLLALILVLASSVGARAVVNSEGEELVGQSTTENSRSSGLSAPPLSAQSAVKASIAKRTFSSLGAGGNGPTPAPSGGQPPDEVKPCPCPCNEVWTAPTWPDETGYGLSPIGGIFETQWIVGQMWKEVPVDPAHPQGEKKSQILVFGIRPESMIFAKSYRGGTAWCFCGTEAEVWEDLKKQKRELLATYPSLTEEDIWVLIFPEGIVDNPPMVVETRTQAVLTN